MRKLFFCTFILSSLIISLAVYAQTGMNTSPVGVTDILSTTMNLKDIFIGSSLLLSATYFVWARALRSTSMLNLALYFSIKSLWILAGEGISILTLFTDNSSLLRAEYALLAVGSILMLIRFTGHLFTLKKETPFYYQFLRYLALLSLFTIPFNYFLSHLEIWLVTQVLTSITLLSLFYITQKIPGSHSRLPVIYTMVLLVQLGFNFISYIVYFSSTSISVLNCLDMMAFWLIAIMVTYLMGRKYRGHLRDEKLTQQQVLNSAKASDIAQKKLLLLQQEGQEQLEFRVQERTLELNIALQELEAVNQELKEKNTLDELSGLFNRRFYDQKILAEFRRSRRNLTPLSIILVDIDHFKSVNDNYGHLAGDQCIVEVANMIKSLLRRSSDVGCRYGGEEFCIILPETDDKGALALAQEICQIVHQKNIVNDKNIISLTVSCGVATYQQEKNITPEVIFSCADKALYKAKQAGRDQVQVGLLAEI
jgi:diguanylate cyclase (GGDEF)-like protein